MAFYFANNGYEFSLIPTKDNRLIFEKEELCFTGCRNDYNGEFMHPSATIIQSAHSEAILKYSSHQYVKSLYMTKNHLKLDIWFNVRNGNSNLRAFPKP